jgi:hypothetical protein
VGHGQLGQLGGDALAEAQRGSGTGGGQLARQLAEGALEPTSCSSRAAIWSSVPSSWSSRSEARAAQASTPSTSATA